MTTAFVLAGGGSLGAVQVGMLQALGARGITPDLLVGTSSGAMNAVWVAQHGISSSALDGLAECWAQIRRSDVFPVRPHQVVRGLLGLDPALVSSAGLADVVRRHAGFAQLEQARTPVHLVATDLLSGASVLLSRGPVVAAVRASASIPGIFAPVPVDGRLLTDGAVAGHSGIAHAVRLGATEIYVLPGGVACALPSPPHSPLGVALHALTVLIEQRLVAEVAAAQAGAGVVVRVLPPLCPLRVSAADFDHATELVRRGRLTSEQWLADGRTDLPRQEQVLSLHDHRGAQRLGLPAQ